MDFAALDIPGLDDPLAPRDIGVIAPLSSPRSTSHWSANCGAGCPRRCRFHLARTPDEPVPVSMGMARLVSNSAHLAAATRDVLHTEPGVVAYLCTSGSFVNGVDAERNLRETICGAGAPDTVTTSGHRPKCCGNPTSTESPLLTPYGADLTAKLRDFPDELNVATVSSDHLGLGAASGRSATAPSPNASSTPATKPPRPSSSAARIRPRTTA